MREGPDQGGEGDHPNLEPALRPGGVGQSNNDEDQQERIKNEIEKLKSLIELTTDEYNKILSSIQIEEKDYKRISRSLDTDEIDYKGQLSLITVKLYHTHQYANELNSLIKQYNEQLEIQKCYLK